MMTVSPNIKMAVPSKPSVLITQLAAVQRPPQCTDSILFFINRGCQTIYAHTGSVQDTITMCSYVFAGRLSSFPVHMMSSSYCTLTLCQIFQPGSRHRVTVFVCVCVGVCGGGGRECVTSFNQNKRGHMYCKYPPQPQIWGFAPPDQVQETQRLCPTGLICWLIKI